MLSNKRGSATRRKLRRLKKFKRIKTRPCFGYQSTKSLATARLVLKAKAKALQKKRPVEKILSHQVSDEMDSVKFLVQWAECSDEDNTWESTERLNQGCGAIDHYLRNLDGDFKFKEKTSCLGMPYSSDEEQEENMGQNEAVIVHENSAIGPVDPIAEENQAIRPEEPIDAQKKQMLELREPTRAEEQGWAGRTIKKCWTVGSL